jgi:phosphate transport system ATP-binding protein
MTDSPLRIGTAVRVQDLTVRYGSVVALRNVSLDIPCGGVTAIVGPSGTGKSTFLTVLNRLTDLVPGCRVEGRVLVAGVQVMDAKADVRTLRQRVGMIFQKPNPFPLSIRRNLELPLREHGIRDRTELSQRVEKALRSAGLWDEVRSRLEDPALTLSGGQQQRLCIARALALEPEILLMDEPTSHLDPMASRIVERHLQELAREVTVVLVTHDLEQARRVSDHLVLFWIAEGSGSVVESGPTKRVFGEPREAATRAYLLGGGG